METFTQIQDAFKNLPGEKGVEARAIAYAPYFCRFGRNVRISENCHFEYPERIELHDGVGINRDALVYGSGGIEIGRNTLIGPRLFIHSANHDVDPGPHAFIERGYHYQRVSIGDNVLISAEAKIMPGAQIGSGAFVAAATLIPAKKFLAGARLFGPIARAVDKTEPGLNRAAPDIAFICHEDPFWRGITEHLLTVLGLPQIGVFQEDDRLPESVRSVLAFGPEGWRPDNAPQCSAVWCFVDGDAAPEETMMRLQEGSEPLPLPRSIEHRLTLAGGTPEDGETTDSFYHHLFWLRTRLEKGAAPLNEDELLGWCCTLWLQRNAPEVDEIVGSVAKRLEEGQDDFNAALLETDFIASLRTRWPVDEEEEPVKDITRKMFANCPSLVCAWVILSQEDSTFDVTALEAKLEDLEPVAINANRLLALECAARIGGLYERGDAIADTLASADWRSEETVFPRIAPGKKALCYHPLLLAAGFLKYPSRSDGFRLHEGRRTHSISLPWSDVTGGSNALIDAQENRISRSLVENWSRLHTAPCPKGWQFQLEENAYGSAIFDVEQVWLGLFRSLIHGIQRPFIQLRPWPSGYRGAISVRYDVDRPVSSQRIAEIATIERDYFGGPCSSWFYFEADQAKVAQCLQHEGFGHEIGVHACEVNDAIAREGVTHHSAPNSRYWQGDQTTASLSERGSIYGEFMGCAFGNPRPAWSEQGAGGSLWCTALHFPLEGSTDDTTLNYFDQNANSLKRALADDGHIIVGSHPDLNQDILKILSARPEMSNLWPVTIKNAIERYRSVMAPGAVFLSGYQNGAPMLGSLQGVSDLRVDIDYGSDLDFETIKIQLTPAQPRKLDISHCPRVEAP